MIALDAMGGDFAPHAIIHGALQAAQRGISVTLFGDEALLLMILEQINVAWKKLPLVIHHCSESIGMGEEPARSVLRKKDSSLIRAIEAVAQGHASAVVSAGNSGAALVAAMMHLGKLPGIFRPAIGGFLPTKKDSVFCIDLGANVDCKPEYLQQFAFMGAAYVQLAKDIKNPLVALLANGTESGKGTRLIQQAHELLSHSSLQFAGNCEPKDIFNDVADVVVCEGFSGNIMLKSVEATVQVVTQWLKDEGNRSMLGRCVGFFAKPVFNRLKKNMNKAQRGGALLLGVSKPCIIAHGSSDAVAVEDAIVFAHDVITSNFHKKFNAVVVELIECNQVLSKEFGVSRMIEHS
jgi:phosphate acyltransferase